VTVRPSLRAAAALFGLSVAPAAAQDDHGTASDAALGFPQFSGEADLRLYGVGTHRVSDPRLRGGTTSPRRCSPSTRRSCPTR
jgi:hypothetical protein